MKTLDQPSPKALKTKVESIPENVDWSLTTWEGARREQLRRWSELPLDRIILALEEMQRISDMLNKPAPIPTK
ncbi:MAG TPA: hypothetical protein VL175_16370 [Pirellulales bacterium]|nr:hypothetical protein [Pirellulales bacterium]